MPSIDSKLVALRRRAAKNTVEVEHLTAFAVLGDPCAAPVIRELAEQYRWSRSGLDDDGALIGPMGRWAEVICAYLEDGASALVRYARRREAKSFHFAVAVLGDLKTTDAVAAMAQLTDDVAKELPERLQDGVELAASLNLTLSFKDPPEVDPRTTKRLRLFLHSLLPLKLSVPQRATVVCALRGVGDDESLRLIGDLPTFAGAWAGTSELVCRVIAKRLKAAARK
jgi:hypothetical protein